MSEAAAATGASDGAAAPAADAASAAVAQTAAPATPAAPAAEATLLGGDPPADPATAEAAPADPKVPVEAPAYVINIPEGETVDQGRLDAYTGALKEAALTQAQADKLTPFLLGQMKAIQEQQLTAWADTTKAWRESVVSDPEIGGAKLRDTMVAAARARDQYGSPEFKALLADNNLGIGNHPAIVRFLASVGRGMGEDLRGADRQSGQPQVSSRDKSAGAVGARMFPNMTV
jgi:hypothetical protein